MIVQTVGKFFKTSTVIVCHCRTCPRRMCTRSTYYYYYYYYYSTQNSVVRHTQPP